MGLTCTMLKRFSGGKDLRRMYPRVSSRLWKEIYTDRVCEEVIECVDVDIDVRALSAHEDCPNEYCFPLHKDQCCLSRIENMLELTVFA